MGFFKKDEIQTNEVQVINEPKIQKKEDEKNSYKQKNLLLFNVDTIQYVIENFPAMSIEIQNGLNNLANILENTIDYVEDKSSEIIKKNRDFKLSKAYRDTSINIYDVVQNIGEYVKWMQDEYEKNIKKHENRTEEAVQELSEENEKESPTVNSESLSELEINQEEVEIYKDFSLKEPKAFRVDDKTVQVDDWDDLLVKTAEILNRQYKQNKNSNKVVKEIRPVEKKSTQNSFRDTVIEMLAEYKINLDEFKIIIK
ncbi:hypothetical protein [Clostridium sp.]|uniref:hypothetical protein n=1 Tax=Clostridium sp. TaxID=1506 RepID=UPI002637D88F|nr:hypothetical protein [Clostridium sp.]